MIKVSVIIPVYNTEKYLKDCLDSVLASTLEDIEVIAIDDNSKDSSLEILKSYQTQFPNKLKVYHNKENIGQGKTRNIGLKIAQGKYVSFVDSDDFIHNEMLEKMYNAAMSEKKPEVVSTRIIFTKDNYSNSSNFEGVDKITVINPTDDHEKIVDESPSCCNKLFLKSSLVNQEFLNTMWEDIAFCYSSMFNAKKIVHVNGVAYFYRKKIDEGVSSKGFIPNPHLLDIFKVADNLELATKRTGRYDNFSEEIKTIQIISCLQRISEVLKWDISLEIKEMICYYMHKKILEKYGNWQEWDLDFLSSRVGTLELDKLKEIVSKYDMMKLDELAIDNIIENIKR